MAPSTPFLDSTIMFSSTSEFEKALKNELFLCHKNMKLSFTELLRMTVADRKTYITLHNREVEKEKKQMENTRRNAKRR